MRALPVDLDLDALARPVGPEVRARIEAHIERMMAVLDDLDGDPDAEPYLAATVGEDRYGCHTPGDDLEHEDDREHEMTDDNGMADLDGLLEQGMRFSTVHVE
ncbi:hypothetical protein [Salinarimonas rosea]|uniref:hypothetical protein n=1 Tax=Salinarimonas rosea TaxID=552063 RepID=UPI000427CBBD|nr:hypothetical protein [Salinarimonas rosea]